MPHCSIIRVIGPLYLGELIGKSCKKLHKVGFSNEVNELDETRKAGLS